MLPKPSVAYFSWQIYEKDSTFRKKDVEYYKILTLVMFKEDTALAALASATLTVEKAIMAMSAIIEILIECFIKFTF